MPRAMFEYTKRGIKKKVSFDANLFCKELKKGDRTLIAL